MKRFATYGGVLVLAVLGWLVLAPAAQADADHHFNLAVDRHVVRSGGQFTATARGDVACNWTLEWNDVVRHGDARVFATTYTAPEVARTTRIPLHGICFHDQSRVQRSSRHAMTQASVGHGASQLLTVTVPPGWRREIVITVLPRRSAVSPPSQGGPGHGAGGILPNTGGPTFWILLAGLGSLLVGAVAATRSRQATISAC
jgi:LPXTG-motif cell wall-anchored protein